MLDCNEESSKFVIPFSPLSITFDSIFLLIPQKLNTIISNYNKLKKIANVLNIISSIKPK